MDPALIRLAYIATAALFIAGLKLLSSPRTAPRGNFIAACGMLIAIGVTLFDPEVQNFGFIISGIVVGWAIGVVLAQKVKMTAMPQMVALLNGLGGGASVLVVASELNFLATSEAASVLEPGMALTVPAVLSTVIGAVALTGSLVAFAKLQELMPGRPIVYPFQQIINLLLLLTAAFLAERVVSSPFSAFPFVGLCLISAVLGVLSVLPIGGADMPVVISLLNSYSGLAASATGFVLNNNALIIGGSLVGASGIILTKVMCKAMNRSLANVLFGAFGAVKEAAPGAAGGVHAAVKSASPLDAATILEAARLVIIVPGYGMAVAQAQHAVRELASTLAKRGAEVKYAIHPVAGRMPGHMNVLLAEADVPYDQLRDMDHINPEFPQADVALVIGANDVTNPAARNNPSSPIYGMPILDVDKARTAMVIKRSMNPGFAGIDNELYTRENTLMVFGDAKDMVKKITQELKEL
jgi:NAD(P) transhydrogenase subunit beta